MTVPKTVIRGKTVTVQVLLTDKTGKALPGLQPLRVTATDAKGAATEYSDYYCGKKGRLPLPLSPALNDQTGNWKITDEDLTAGLEVSESFSIR